MREKNIKTGVLLVLIGLVMFYGVLKDNEKKTDVLFEDYSTARFNAAVQDEKPIMLFFTAKWCDYCQKLKKGPFREEKVAESAKGIALFTVDMTDESIQENVRLSERYNILGYPTLIFISADGKEISEARINGFVKSDEIIKSLKRIKE